MSYEFVAVFEKKATYFIGYVEEISGVNLQSLTLEEARQDLKEAIELVTSATRTLANGKVCSARSPGFSSKGKAGWFMDSRFKKHLVTQGCFLHRKGRKYSVYIHPRSGRISTVPHVRKIDNTLAEKICCDLGIPKSMEMEG
mgnify:CR=1 FL=1